VNVAIVTGLKSRILGYMSIGDNVWGHKRPNANQAKDLDILTQYSNVKKDYNMLIPKKVV